jgi:hypothetical protein
MSFCSTCGQWAAMITVLAGADLIVLASGIGLDP